MSKNDIEKKKENNLIGIKLYVVLFLIIYAFLQIGFSGLYTYTTWGVLYTCFMYFSIFTLFTLVYVFFKFRKKDIKEEQVKNVLKRMFNSCLIIIIVFSLINIYTFLYNMYGIKIEKENYNKNTNEVVSESKIENITENVVNNGLDDTMDVVEGILEYNIAMQEFDKVYEVMKEKLPVYIGFRVLTDVIDIVISSGVIFILSDKLIMKIKKEEKIKEKIEE